MKNRGDDSERDWDDAESDSDVGDGDSEFAKGLDSTAKPTGGAPPRKAAIAFILFTLFIDVLGIGIVIPVLPELVKELIGGEISEAGVYFSVIMASYALMQFFFAPLIGACSDRFGRRPVLLASMFGFSVNFLIQALAPTVWWLLLGRVVAGISGASFTTANAYIADISTSETRARNFGFAGMMFGLGFIIGPALGGLLGGISIRLPFYVSAGLAIINWLYGYFVLPESLPPEDRSDLQLSKANPLGTMVHLRNFPLVAALVAPFVLISLGQRGLENVWVLNTGYRYGWDEVTNGLTLGLVGLTAAIVQGGMVRPIIARYGERRTAVFATLVSGTAFMGYAFATQGWMVWPIIIFGSLGGLGGPAIQSLVAGAVPSHEQGKVQGALTSLVSLTNVIAPLIFTGGLFSYFTSSAAPFEFAGAPFVLGSVLVFIASIVLSKVFKRFPAEHSEHLVPTATSDRSAGSDTSPKD